MKEEEVRPQKVFDEYLKLAEIDAITFFNDVDSSDIQCPACNSDGEYAFNKSGFNYSSCPNCNTLYVTPRPESRAFTRYYTEAPSAEYWATNFYKVTADARREKLWKPKAKMIYNIMNKYENKAVVIDVGGGYGIFAEEMKKISGESVIVVEPSPHLAKSCRDREIPVIEKFLENVSKNELPNGSKVFVSFELFEHLHTPSIFLNQMLELMTSGDMFIFTTLSSTGIDIQGLWKNSKSVSPPHHLNFFNPYSIKRLISKIGLNCLEVTTPGMLDIDILSNNKNLINDRFLKTFVTYATEDEKDSWQKMISKTGWSSHMMVCCQKP